jgi:hypothetical protein
MSLSYTNHDRPSINKHLAAGLISYTEGTTTIAGFIFLASSSHTLVVTHKSTSAYTSILIAGVPAVFDLRDSLDMFFQRCNKCQLTLLDSASFALIIAVD